MCDHVFVILEDWWQQNRKEWVQQAIATCTCVFHVGPYRTYRDLCHKIVSTYFCKLPGDYCHTQLLHQEAVVRTAIFSCFASENRSMSGGSQSCAHCKGQSLRAIYSYYTVLVSSTEKFRKVCSCIRQLISQVILATVLCLNEVRLNCHKQLW